ncbi:MFS general substrate transporter [Xylaria nigripes]|nr:MFS general substrate transporter [Xylaria nigripes]
MNMNIDIYWTGLLVLVAFVTVVAGHKTILTSLRRAPAEKQTCDPLDDEAKRFQLTFLRVYLLVVGSEWLQNPFMYSLYRNEKTLGEGTVATLYISTYVAAAISALFTGYLTDRFGRRKACLVFCGIHSLAAVSVCFDKLWILILGRILGGLALTLLWTAFESWMITEYNDRGFAQSSLSLSSMFGIITTSKCLTAIFTGLLGHYVVLALGSKIHPFILGVALDSFAAVLIMDTWNENRGTSPIAKADTEDPERTTLMWDKRVWALGFVTCCFEGTIFLFVFFWPGTLQDAHARTYPNQDDPIPHGVIFASFMAIMVLGALFFNLIAADPNDSRLGEPARYTLSPTLLLTGTLIVSAVCFSVTAFVQEETVLFLLFLLLEVCNGIYIPNAAYHRGTIVSDAARARVYSFMNIPLFLFVIVALRTTNGSAGGHWKPVFLFCGALLLVAALITSLFLDTRNTKSSGPYSSILNQQGCVSGAGSRTDLEEI